MTYGRPGVYINERNLPSPITAPAVSNAAGACVGVFEKGPTDVTLVTSWYDFAKKFGGFNTSYPASFEVNQFFRNGGAELYVRRVLHDDAGYASVDLVNGVGDPIGTVTAAYPGEEGSNLRVQLISNGTVSGVDYYTLNVYLEQGTDSASTADDVLIETWRNVVLEDSASSDFIETVINGISEYITVTMDVVTGTPASTLLPLTGINLNGTTPVGTDAVTALSDYDTLDRPLVFFVPAIWKDFASGTDALDIQQAVLTWCASHNSFAILDTDAGLDVGDDETGALGAAASIGASAYGAVYYPNVYIPDPLGRSRSSLRKIGPASSVAGIALATDRTYGPYKTPAGLNSALTNVVSPEKVFTSTELDSLNTATLPVNAIRSVPGAGTVVMGGRTLLQDGSFNRYVAMRRSLNYIRKQATVLTEFALFELNQPVLWSRIKTTLDVFLNEYRNQGGLRGNIPSDAYFIKCDQENNTPTSIANGEINIEIGVALEYPAEFVVITLTQKTIN